MRISALPSLPAPPLWLRMLLQALYPLFGIAMSLLFVIVTPLLVLLWPWDRRLATGTISPDRTLDLHGHTLATAHAALDAWLERAIRSGDRVVLLVTGRPPRRDSERPHARGAIRGHIADWIALSRHAGRIAAVRPAHPRHGGQGALYVILRRPGR